MRSLHKGLSDITLGQQTVKKTLHTFCKANKQVCQSQFYSCIVKMRGISRHFCTTEYTTDFLFVKKKKLGN